MPYIEQKLRENLDKRTSTSPWEPGELNYMITRLCNEYLIRQGQSYRTLNDIVGVLECAKAEFYRRIAVPYEEQKKAQNGDVYQFEGVDF